MSLSNITPIVNDPLILVTHQARAIVTAQGHNSDT